MEPKTIAEQLMFTTVRFTVITNSGKESVATGFIFGYRYKENRYDFIVTNKHVISDNKEVIISFIKKKDSKPDLGNPCHIRFTEFNKIWIGHHDKEIDVGVVPLAHVEGAAKKHGFELFYIVIRDDLIPNNEQLKDLDVLEDVVFIGYPSGIWDEKNFTPIFRSGITATPITLDYNGKPQFVIDAAVFGGSSGSPVFAYTKGPYRSGDALKLGQRLHFVGIVTETYYLTEKNKIEIGELPTSIGPFVNSKQMLNLGIVFKTKTIIEIIKPFLEELDKQGKLET